MIKERTAEGYIPSIDGLRAVAVMVVVLFHAGVEVFSGGFVGVDVFFVISGFVITRMIWNKLDSDSFKLSNFYLGRIRRLAPALIFTIILTLCISVLVLPKLLVVDTAKSAASAILSFSNIFFWLSSDYFDTESLVKPLLHTWSLSVEEQFYFFWPFLVIFLASKLKLDKSSIAFIFIIILTLALSQWVVVKDSSASFYLMPTRIYEFALGGLAFLIRGRSQLKHLESKGASVIGITLVSIAVFFFDENTQFPGLMALVPCVGTFLIITSCHNGLMVKLLANRPVLLLGRASYSIYLIHWPIVVFWYVIFGELNLSAAFTIILTSVLCGILMFKYIESPFRNPQNVTILAPKRTFLCFSAMVTLILVVCVFLILPQPSSKQDAQDPGFSANMGFKEMIDAICNTETEDNLAGYDCKLASNSQTGINVIAIGDSHVGHLIPGLAMLSKNEGINFEIQGSGGFFPGKNVVTYRGAELQTSKNTLRSKLYRVLSKKDPSVIIISARWSVYFDSDLREKEGAPSIFLARNESDVVNKSRSKKVFKASINETIKYLTSFGHRLIIVGQIPEANNLPLECRGTFSEEVSIDNCEPIKMSDATFRTKASNLFLKRIAAKYEGVAYIDPADFFCASGQCITVVDKHRPVYRDGNHVTAYVSVDFSKSTIFPYLTSSLREIPEK